MFVFYSLIQMEVGEVVQCQKFPAAPLSEAQETLICCSLSSNLTILCLVVPFLNCSDQNRMKFKDFTIMIA